MRNWRRCRRAPCRQICQSQDGAETVDLPGRFATGEKGREACWDLYPGIALCFLDYLADHTGCRHQRTDGVLEIDYCRRGQGRVADAGRQRHLPWGRGISASTPGSCVPGR